MLILKGVIDNMTEPKKVTTNKVEKKVVEVTVLQKQPGKKSSMHTIEIWSDSDYYDTVMSLGEGEEVAFEVFGVAEKFNDKFTGRVKYVPTDLLKVS